MRYYYRCSDCERERESDELLTSCPDCGGRLNLERVEREETLPPGSRAVAGAIGGGILGAAVGGPVGAVVGGVIGAILGSAVKEQEQ